MNNYDLLAQTKALLAKTDAKSADICCAISVSPRWLAMFRAGQADSASVIRVQALHDYLIYALTEREEA